ncbi:DUF58 domain-containing protein [Pseudorhodoferax sp.]|uniref:DUF58 domain-containing protein n=1 Tax=Pseudorhodoferax sp. TaxID=1993553 RepID=UPI002DD64D2D|nr:DUF58 domain-containing protein [Pseudorhodoferax sp.]
MKSSPPEPKAPASRADQLLRRLEWTVLRRLDGLLQGDYRTLMRGTGMDLADLREYQHHDDVRHIDWNVTARLQQPHVRVFTEDREMAAWFLLDLSPSVDFGSGEQKKREVSAHFVAVLARLLTRHGNRVGAMLYGSGLDQVLPPRASRLHVLDLLHRMLPADQPPGKTVEPGRVTHLHELLQAAGGLMRRRSTVFVVSDFISAPGWEKPMAQLAQRHEVLAVRLLDPLELELPDLGLIPIRDAETGEQLLVDTSDAGFRKRFARIAAQREAELRQALGEAGVDTLELSTDDDLAGAVLRFAELRRRRSRLSGAGGGLPTHLRPLAA